MNFDWNPTQNQLYKATLRFSQQLSEKCVIGQFDRNIWRDCGQNGILGLPVSTTYGGMGLDALTSARVMEALGHGCIDRGLVFAIGAHLFACVMPIYEHGSDLLKQKLLPKLCSGEWIAGNAVSETESGSEIAAMAARAVKKSDYYILNGAKCYVTNGPVADVFLVYASTNPAHGYMGISAFVVEKDLPGLSVGKPFSKMGLETAQTGFLYLVDCAIPASHRIGKEGDGLNVFNQSMHWERTGLFAGFLGAMECQIGQMIEYANQRKQFRKPIARNQAVSHKIVDAKMELEAARLLLYRACWQIDQQNDATLDVSLAKLAISESAIRTALTAVQVHGAFGTLLESGIPQGLTDVLPSSIFSGTSDIQRNIIAGKLGL